MCDLLEKKKILETKNENWIFKSNLKTKSFRYKKVLDNWAYWKNSSLLKNVKAYIVLTKK